MKKLTAFCLTFILLLGTTVAQETETEEGFDVQGTDECEDYDNLGLWTYDGESLNLIGLNTSVFIEGPYALVEHTLLYENTFTEDSNLVFYFKRPNNSIISNVSATWANKEVEWELISQEDAEDIYNAFSAEERAIDIDTVGLPALVIGRVPGGRDVTITFQTISPLTLVDNKFWAYSLYSSIAASDDFRSRDWNSTVDYEDTFLQGAEIDDWNLKVNVSTRRGINITLNPNYELRPNNTEINNRFYTTWETTVDPNKDFIIFFSSPRIHIPAYVFTEHPNYDSDYVFGYSFVPDASNRSLIDVATALSTSSSIDEADQNDNNTAIMVNIFTTVSCNNSDGDIIFSANSTDEAHGRGEAYEKYFYLRNLEDPEGCKINFTYVNTYTRAIHWRSFNFRGFSLASTTDEWHKIAYADRIQELEREEDGDDGADQGEEINELALRYQLKTANNVWVTVDVSNNRTIVDDSVDYLYATKEDKGETEEVVEGVEGIGDVGEDDGTLDEEAEAEDEVEAEEDEQTTTVSGSAQSSTTVTVRSGSSGNSNGGSNGDQGGY